MTPSLQNLVLEQLANLAVGTFEEGQPDRNQRFTEDGNGLRLHSDLSSCGAGAFESGVAVVGSEAEVEYCGRVVVRTVGQRVSFEDLEVIPISRVQHARTARGFPPLNGNLKAERAPPKLETTVPVGGADGDMVEATSRHGGVLVSRPFQRCSPKRRFERGFSRTGEDSFARTLRFGSEGGIMVGYGLRREAPQNGVKDVH